MDIIGHARIIYVGKSQSCMVYNGRLIPHASYDGKVGALEEKTEIRRAHADGDDANDVGVLQGPELIGLVAKRANDLFSQLIAAPPPPPPAS